MGPEEEMKVVGHQAVAENPHRQAFAGRLKEGDEGDVVRFLVEDVGPGVAAIEDVVAPTTERGASCARHGVKRITPGTDWQGKVECPPFRPARKSAETPGKPTSCIPIRPFLHHEPVSLRFLAN